MYTYSDRCTGLKSKRNPGALYFPDAGGPFDRSVFNSWALGALEDIEDIARQRYYEHGCLR